MSTFTVIVISFLAGFALGYILCDLLTTERKVTVNIKKQKVKGENNTLEAVTDIEVDQKKERKGFFKRLRNRKLRKNKL
jgi:uncharacterized membrane protein YciS (DUF1049 family)